MARFRRALRLRPVNSVKHIVDFSQSVAANTQTELVLVRAKDNPTLAVPNDVAVGSTVSWIYLTFEVEANEQSLGAIPNFYMYVWKNPGGNLTATSPATTGDSDNKKHIIHQEMVMFENVQAGVVRNVFKGVIRIPPRMKRFGFEDELNVVFVAPSLITVSCLQCIYKEFR